MTENKTDTGDANITESVNQTAIIPDFFHDIIAYLIPGFTVLILVLFDCYVYKIKFAFPFTKSGYFDFFILLIASYVIGRFFESLGYLLIHKRGGNPKWTLLFDDRSNCYTQIFKENLISKIEEHLNKQKGKELIDQCKNNKKDDYFNIIQYYLRERFPSVAYYEKKQNAVKVSSRSLTLIFGINSLFTAHYLISTDLSSSTAPFSDIPIHIILVFQILATIIFYMRFQTDKKYHAMYVFEVFIATKKLLKTKEPKKDNKANSADAKIPRG